MFLTDEEPYDPAPPTKDYTTYDESDDPVAIAMSQNVYTSKYAPQVNQVFFIGDGSSTVDNLQYCEIPAEASRLYLGFVDADDSGLVGFYDDNLGKLLVEYEIYNNYILDAPAPSVPQGLILYYTFDNQRQSVSEIGNLDDSSGFGFHGTLNHWDNESDEPLENYIEFPQEAKYANSVRFVDEKTSIVIANGTPYMYNSGTPPMADWTISTWFMCSHEHLILHVAPETKCMGHFNCYPGLLFGINPSNFELSAATTQFREGTMIIDLKYMGSGFYMNELEEGWHHLTATGTNGETRFLSMANLLERLIHNPVMAFIKSKPGCSTISEFTTGYCLYLKSECWLKNRTPYPPISFQMNASPPTTLTENFTFHVSTCREIPIHQRCTTSF